MIKIILILLTLSCIIYAAYYFVKEYKLYSFIAKSLVVIASAALILTAITYIF